MFPRLWQRAVAYFERLLFAAFEEAERRVDATIAQQFEFPGPGTPLPSVNPPSQQPSLPAPQSDFAPFPASQSLALPPLPAVPPVAAPHPEPGTSQSGTGQPDTGQPVRRPRGRPRKEPSK